jgi:S-adenosylmethionine-diacylgycerolhomoserine-N-methlytransferase
MSASHTDAAWTMDRIYRRQRHIYDASRKFFLLGRDRLIDGLDVPVDGTVLELGCGTGRNLVAVAGRYPHARLYGLDISEQMLRSALRSIARRSLRTSIALAQADAVTFDSARIFGVPAFDRIFISYSLSMIPEWQPVLDRAVRLLAPGGSLHVVDFGQQAGLPAWFRRALLAWLRRFHVAPRGDLARALGRAAAETGGGLHFERLHRDYAWYARLTVPER